LTSAGASDIKKIKIKATVWFFETKLYLGVVSGKISTV
jgi:hypothetical protein